MSVYIVLIMIAAVNLPGQGTPPCRVARIEPFGKKADIRFFSHPPDLVKKRLIRALWAIGAEVRNETGQHIEAGHERSRMLAAQAVTSVWVNKKGGMGKFAISLLPESQKGKSGTSVQVEFHKNKVRGRLGKDGWATPLLDETECLLNTLASADPEAQPAGQPGPGPTGRTEVKVPAGVEIKAALDDALYTRELNPDRPIILQVVQDVRVEGNIVIRRGALATGSFTQVKKAKNFGRGGEIEFQLETVIAADGQKLALLGQKEAVGDARHQVWSMSIVLGAITKGNNALVRAGTVYSAEVAKDSLVILAAP